jgi:CBS-domain-containing membrane protein
MSVPAVSCREDDTLHVAASKMWNRDCGALPVVTPNKTIIGIITDRDICIAACSLERRLSEISVAEITTGNVFSVSPYDSIRFAERLMRKHQVRRLPVVDEADRLIGMLSLNDIAREAQREMNHRLKKEINSEEIMQTLATICEPSNAESPYETF